jgi:hypothetical protein
MRHLKVALLFAVAAMFALMMIGCGGDDEGDGEAAAVTATNPADGGEMFANGELVINFDAAVKEVKVNGSAAVVAGTKATWKGTGLAVGQGTLEITWTDENDNTGSKTITLTIKEEDTVPPEVTSIETRKGGTNLDGANNLEPADMNDVDAGGIVVKFSEPVNGAKFTLAEEGTAIKWIDEMNDAKTEAVLTPGPDGALRHEGKYTLTVTGYKDGAGNAGADAEVTFTMKGKEQ